jgi:hypothetical protein
MAFAYAEVAQSSQADDKGAKSDLEDQAQDELRA